MLHSMELTGNPMKAVLVDVKNYVIGFCRNQMAYPHRDDMWLSNMLHSVPLEILKNKISMILDGQTILLCKERCICEVINASTVICMVKCTANAFAKMHNCTLYIISGNAHYKRSNMTI